MKKSWLKLIAPLFAIALIGAACGGSDSDSESSSSSDTESSTETETTEAPETEDTVLEAGTEAEGDVDTEVEAVVEESSYGGTVINQPIIDGRLYLRCIDGHIRCYDVTTP